MQLGWLFVPDMVVAVRSQLRKVMMRLPPSAEGPHDRERIQGQKRHGANGERRLETVMRLMPRVRSFVRSLIRDEHAADEIMAEVNVVAWRRLPDIPNDEARAMGWLRATARNVVRAHLRARTRRHRLQERVAFQLIGLESSEPPGDPERLIAEELWTALGADDRELLTWMWEDRPQQDMATALGISIGALRMRLLRLRRRLADELDLAS